MKTKYRIREITTNGGTKFFKLEAKYEDLFSPWCHLHPTSTYEAAKKELDVRISESVANSKVVYETL